MSTNSGKKTTRKKTARKSSASDETPTVQPREDVEVTPVDVEKTPTVDENPGGDGSGDRGVNIETNFGYKSIIRFGKHGTLNLADIQTAGLDFVEEVGKNAKTKTLKDLEPVVRKAEEIVTKSVPMIGKLAAAKVQRREIEEAKAIAKDLLKSEFDALEGLMHAANIHIQNNVVETFKEATHKAIAQVANLAMGAIKYL